MQRSETCLNFSHIFHIFFILCQTCEPFVVQCCWNWLLAELVVMLDSGFQVLGSNPVVAILLCCSTERRGILPPNYSQWGLINQVLACDCGWRA